MSGHFHVWRIACFSGLVCVLTSGCGPAMYNTNPMYGPSPVYPTPITPQPGYSPVTVTPGYPPNTPGPVVSNPNGPVSPSVPTVPVSTPGNQPVPIPYDPPSTPNNPAGGPVGDVTAQWAPWPLPPQKAAAVATMQGLRSQSPGVHTGARAPRRFRSGATRPGSRAESVALEQAAPSGDADNKQLANGSSPSPMDDLHYRGGKTLQNMAYVNLYVSGEQGWNMSDVEQIDKAIEAAMNDEYLNNVIRQYFNNGRIGTRVHPSHPLIGYLPKEVKRSDIQSYLQYLYGRGYLDSYDLSLTVFNFLCPPGTVLSDDDGGSGAEAPPAELADSEAERPIGFPEDEAEVDSLGGLGGYHGSIHLNGKTIYYSAIVYSERRANGTVNGIPVFPDNWKNVVATLYHELQEARTDPDVEDVIRNPYTPNIVRMLGWTSDAGEEIGDYPLHGNTSIRNIIKEVPLADGSGTIPIQLQYSNAVHGPEGPIPQPYATPAR